MFKVMRSIQLKFVGMNLNVIFLDCFDYYLILVFIKLLFILFFDDFKLKLFESR